MNDDVQNLPLPPPTFGGSISENYKQAKADFPQPV